MPASYGFGLIEFLRVDEDQTEGAFLSFLAQVRHDLRLPVLRQHYDGETFIDGGEGPKVAEAGKERVAAWAVVNDPVPELMGADVPRGTLDKLVGGVDLIVPGAPAEAEIYIPEALDHDDLNNPAQAISTDEARRRLGRHSGLDHHDRSYVDDLLRCCRLADEHGVVISISWL